MYFFSYNHPLSGVCGSLLWDFKVWLNIKQAEGMFDTLPGLSREPHCAKETAPLIMTSQAGAREPTWFLCRAPSSSSDAVFMVPHRSFTILRRICAFGPPVPGCAKQSRVSCDSSYSIQKENWVFGAKRSTRLQPRKLRTEIPPVAPAWPRVIPINRMKFLQAPVRVTWNTITSQTGIEGKKKCKFYIIFKAK